MTPPADPDDPAPDALPLDPSATDVEHLLHAVTALVGRRQLELATRPLASSSDDDSAARLLARLLADRPGDPVPIDDALATFEAVLRHSDEHGAGGALAYIPGSGLLSAAVGELLAASANRYTGLPSSAPAAVALEAGVLRWVTELFGLPAATSQAVLLSGGSLANLTALTAARERHAPGNPHRAVVYVGDQAHASVRKAARIAGLLPEHVRVCPTGDGLRLDPEAVRVAVKEDRRDGLLPVAVVAAGGTTNAGAVDPLDELADLARDCGTWLHVDAAYGGFFQLTDRGRARLAGIERADSITLDPHKSLFLPYGTGALAVRDRSALAAAFAEEADYLRDLDDADGLPDFAGLTPELTRDWRGMKLWLPLQLHGLEVFRRALDDKLDLAHWAWQQLESIPGVRTRGAPDLSIVVFRVPGDDVAQDRALERINADGQVRLSSTTLDGEVVLRLAVLSHRTRREHVQRVIEHVDGMARSTLPGPPSVPAATSPSPLVREPPRP
jgi:aromatic-L-amino-acid/L-tryptophan decarboxylase